MDNCWRLTARDPQTLARTGLITTRSGDILPTPLFQPVATAGTIRSLDWRDLEDLGYRHALMNTYHLVVRPGTGPVLKSGGIAKYTGWRGSVLTDSGGYQVHSLASRRSIREDGIHFTDHIDGGRWHFTPEFTLRAQLAFGVDFAMCLDICTGLPATRNRVVKDLAVTHRWAREQASIWHGLQREYPFAGTARLFGIVQGGLFEDLRAESVEVIGSAGFDGIAVGGLAVGEEREDFLRMTEYCGGLLCTAPHDQKVHYLMGVGEPADLLYAIAKGFDLFDCVQPTRLARHGVAFTRQGKLKLKQARFTHDGLPLDPQCRCSTCRRYTRAYLRHLFSIKEHSYARLVTIHNLAFYRDLMNRAHRRIEAGNYGAWWQRQYELVSQELPQ